MTYTHIKIDVPFRCTTTGFSLCPHTPEILDLGTVPGLIHAPHTRGERECVRENSPCPYPPPEGECSHGEREGQDPERLIHSPVLFPP